MIRNIHRVRCFRTLSLRIMYKAKCSLRTISNPLQRGNVSAIEEARRAGWKRVTSMARKRFELNNFGHKSILAVPKYFHPSFGDLKLVIWQKVSELG